MVSERVLEIKYPPMPTRDGLGLEGGHFLPSASLVIIDQVPQLRSKHGASRGELAGEWWWEASNGAIDSRSWMEPIT